MKRKTAKTIASIIIAICLFLIAGAKMQEPSEATPNSLPQPSASSTQSASTTSTPLGATNALVIKVVDGDTISAKLDSEPDKEVKIRFLGVNTPETVDPRRPVECFGKEASDFTKHLLTNQRVNLLSDPEADEVDKYGRLLRNVYLADGTDINAELVRQGFANAYVSFPQNDARKAELRALEAEAKENQRGLWNPANCPTNE